jgi:hypothetical protein
MTGSNPHDQLGSSGVGRFGVGFGAGRLGDLLGLFRACLGIGDPAGGVVACGALTGACLISAAALLRTLRTAQPHSMESSARSSIDSAIMSFPR